MARKEEKHGKKFMKRLNKTLEKLNNEHAIVDWNHSVNLTQKNFKKKLDTIAKVADEKKKLWTELKFYHWQTYDDYALKRQFKLFSIIGPSALPDDKSRRFTHIVTKMQSIYAKTKIRSFSDKSKRDLNLEPDIVNIMASCRDPDELRHIWTEWHNVSGRNVRDLYEECVTLSNETAVLNGFHNMADLWLEDFEDPNFVKSIDLLWEQVRPLYLQLHAYVRRRLRLKYGDKIVSQKGSIPAHLLGNMWAQSWVNIYDLTQPFPERGTEDVTQEMVNQGYTPLKMFKMAEDFCTSLKLSPMPNSFWEKSILEKPNDGREMICHATAYDFFDGNDFRIKQCTKVCLEDFKTVHHAMGHIQYYLHYKHQPSVYRGGANSGFHEAIGDVITLSFSTRNNLKKIGLLKSYENDLDDKRSAINELYKICLEKIPFLPFAYIMDLWRWNVFRGKIKPNQYNLEWWRLKESYQGVQSPVSRTEFDFDIGAKFHTVANVPYIGYFVSFIIQFQFHAELCKLAGKYNPYDWRKPLHEADIYNSSRAGSALKKMMRMGKSRHWREAMKAVTGQRDMKARPLLQYFQPIHRFLIMDNEKNKEYIGWDSDMTRYEPCPCCKLYRK